MKREFLEGLKLEKETIDQIMAEHGKTMIIEKSKIEALEKTKGDLEGQVKERDTQLEALKKIDAGKLQEEIARLQGENKTAAATYSTELAKLQKTSALKLALQGIAHDPSDIMTAIDMDKLSLDEAGNLKDKVDDLIKPIKEAKPYLFVEQKPDDKTPSITGAKPAAPAGAAAPAKGNADPFVEGFNSVFK